LQLHLAIGISRGERMDYAIQKSVELGVSQISPLFSSRSMVRLKPDRRNKRVAHWQGVIRSACEQSGRSRLPILNPPTELSDWLSSHPGGLMLYHQATDTLATRPAPGSELNLLIGPEGGLSDAERAKAVEHGYKAVRLGPRVLRTETAPIAALAAIQVLWGDFR
jgi:16S rRNA (uracil1498-N3)-methyltransferase